MHHYKILFSQLKNYTRYLSVLGVLYCTVQYCTVMYYIWPEMNQKSICLNSVRVGSKCFDREVGNA